MQIERDSKKSHLVYWLNVWNSADSKKLLWKSCFYSLKELKFYVNSHFVCIMGAESS